MGRRPTDARAGESGGQRRQVQPSWEHGCRAGDREEAPDGPLAMLSIVDQGVGIPAADLPHIFERFRRGGNVADRIAGSGLGLWGSQRIVAQHGGTIAIDSTEGNGTTVTVRLPLKVNHEISDDTPPAPIETTATRSAD